MFHPILSDVVGSISAFEYAYNHLNLVAYPSVGVFLWKASQWFTETKSVVAKTVDQIDTLATNHFPHMEKSLATQDKLLHEMNGSLKTIAKSSCPPGKKQRK